MDKLKMRTTNLADENYAKLAELFPNAITETIDENGSVVRAIDPDVLQQEINTHVLTGKEERYQFTWPDKRKSVLLANAPIAAALRPCREESVNFDTTENLYIEGDNLDVLKLLRETYLNRVKMIYIDPPYNTGNDFVYEDDFAEDAGEFLIRDGQYDEDGNRMVRNLDSKGRFHTDWLNMIYSRLRIARDLLSEDGVVFISIDDGEVHNLRKICDEVFGEVGFIVKFVWKSKPQGGNDNTHVVAENEYVLVYSKYSDKLVLRGRPIDDDKYNLKDEHFDYRGGYSLAKLDLSTLEYRINLDYPIEAPDGTIIYAGGVDSKKWQERQKNNNRSTRDWQWRWSQERYKASTINGFSEFINRNGNWVVYTKEYQNVDKDGVYIDRERKHRASIDFCTNIDGTKECDELVGKRVFSFPKPPGLVKHFLYMSTTTNDIILDFFSGSATTAHAVMQLNAEDGGKRKYILVQLPEICDEGSEAAKAGYKNICEIGKERIRRAGHKIVDESPIDRADLDIGFRVLKLDSSNMKDVYYTPDEYAQMQFSLDGFMDNIKEDRTSEDMLFQVMLDLGIPLSSKIEHDGEVWSVNDGYLIACFGKTDTTLLTEIAKQKPSYAVFRDSSFASDSAMVNFEQVFATHSPTTNRQVL